jgi:HPt (histidine-containing phosphotransfer) domain-containing protein
MLTELIEMFLKGVPDSIAQLKAASHGRAEFVTRAQTLKSMCMNLGAKKMVEQCRELETASSAESAGELIAQLETVFEQTAAELKTLR